MHALTRIENDTFICFRKAKIDFLNIFPFPKLLIAFWKEQKQFSQSNGVGVDVNLSNTFRNHSLKVLKAHKNFDFK